jgi:hypothetical protein
MAMNDLETTRASSAVSEPTNTITVSNSNMNIDKDHHHHNNNSSSSSSSNNNIPVGSRRERKRSKKNAALLRRTIRIENRHAILGEGKQHKWLGGAVDAQTGKIYGIPSHANEIICIESPPPLSSSTTSPLQSSWVVEQCSSSTTTTTTTTARISTIPLPSTAYRHGPFKWLRGIVYNDCLYGIPSWHTGGVLKVNLRNVDNVAAAAAAAADEDGKTTLRREVVSILPLPHESSYYEDCGVDSIMDDQVLQNYRENNNTKEDNADDDDIVNRARWMWHGGAIGNGGDGASSFSSSSSPPPPPAIYCPPSNAEHVLKVYLDGTDRVEEIGPKFVKGQNKWYGK